MATTKKSTVEVWPSGISGLLVGEASCVFASWFKSNYKFVKRPGTFDFAAWKIDHTALVNRTVQRLGEQGWKCSIENQNHFRLAGKTCVLVGKPDIVGRKSGRVLVVDCKTGMPKDSHAVQVGIYMLALPMVWGRELVLSGTVTYLDHDVDVPLEQVTQLRDKLFQLLRTMGGSERPAVVPSASECRFCDLTKVDCDARIDEPEHVDVTTSEW